jgi:hypothetical protein
LSRRLVPALAVIVAACRDAASSVFPETPLGRVGRDWLAAHNRAEGHAVVHFTMVNRGSGPMSGAQVDSAVYAGVKLARTLGPLVPVKVVESSDTSLAVLLTARDGGLWTARFKPVAQPSAINVDVHVTRAWVYRGGSSLESSP